MGGFGESGGVGSMAEAWMAKTGLTWPWAAGNNSNRGARDDQFHHEAENVALSTTLGVWADKRFPASGFANPGLAPDGPGSWTGQNVNSGSSSGSNTPSTSRMEYEQLENLDCEVLWEDLTLGEAIGQGKSFIP